MALLEIRDLTLEFVSGPSSVRVLNGISLQLEKGKTLCIAGESGSGKSVTALSIARLLPSPPARYPRGKILLDGNDVLAMPPSELGRIRGKLVSYIFQDPGNSLNPVVRVGAQIREALDLHRPDLATREEVVRLLRLVRIPDPEQRADAYPFQLSGGMQQRVMIAMALACQPKLLVADEPTSALDPTIQAQITSLLRELREQLGMALLMITHNLGIVAELADDLLLMRAGEVVEAGPAAEVLRAPKHPYTRALIDAVPQLPAGARHRGGIA